MTSVEYWKLKGCLNCLILLFCILLTGCTEAGSKDNEIDGFSLVYHRGTIKDKFNRTRKPYTPNFYDALENVKLAQSVRSFSPALASYHYRLALPQLYEYKRYRRYKELEGF